MLNINLCKLLNHTLSCCVGKVAPEINSVLPDLIVFASLILCPRELCSCYVLPMMLCWCCELSLFFYSLNIYFSTLQLVEEAFPKYDAAGKDGEMFRRFVAGIDKALQIKIHEMGATTFDEALDIAVRVERASLIGQTSTSPDHVVASTSSKRDY